MAGKPFIQKLQHNKLLTKLNFPTFVETYNAVTARVENLKGDNDLTNDTKGGYITVDNTDWEHPVIRFNPSNLNLSGGGGSIPVSGYTGSINVLTGVSFASDFSAIVFETKNLVYESGLLSSVTAGTPITLGAQIYGNVTP